MKKVIFISALAIAAAVSCTKSDIVDTKFDDAIGFTTYLGRDAQTKAAETTTATLTEFGVYGFYTATEEYDPEVNTTANLMDHQKVTKSGSAWTYTPAKYWTNGTDNYTFFAYAPYSVGKAGGAPVIEYTVDDDLENQQDVIYSINNRDVTKEECTVTSGEGDDATSTTYVPFTFKHALARLSVKAKAVMYDAEGTIVTEPAADQVYDNTFAIKGITITGAFHTTGTMDLSAASPEWEAEATAGTVYDLTGEVDQELTAELYDFSATSNYLMMIPTDFSTTNAILSVTYTVTYAGVESDEITKTVAVPTNFVQGKAYTINLTLQRDEANAIVFTVESVDGWVAATPEQDSSINA